LYVADWTNPIINHGEVDFRDPRRDKQRGRIWRIAPAGSKPLAWQPLAGRPTAELLTKLTSPSRWEFEQARRELLRLPPAQLTAAVAAWAKDDVSRRHAAWLLSGRADQTADLIALLRSTDAVNVQVALRELGKAHAQWREGDLALVGAQLRHPNPRVQLEAFRALARVPSPAAADLILDHLPANPEDSFLDFAAWTSVNDTARAWLADLAAHPEKVAGREAKLERIVKIADPVVAAPYIKQLFAGRQLDAAGTGPWIELIGRSGGPEELTTLFAALTKEGALQPAARVRAAAALVEAAVSRNGRPNGDLGALGALFASDNRDLRIAAVRLSGAWKLANFVPPIASLAGQNADGGVRDLAFKALRDIGQAASVKALQQRWQAESQSIALDRKLAQKLWDAFRQPLDEVFQRKTQDRSQQTQALSAHDQAVLDASKALEIAIAQGDVAVIRQAMQHLSQVVTAQPIKVEPSDAKPIVEEAPMPAMEEPVEAEAKPPAPPKKV
ncbi:hypothetical protein EBR16_07595, partial [bacterium]|nr:hypothetical protein [bacterium]